jgi:hypothetical protein
MALRNVSLDEVAHSPDLRLDPHHFVVGSPVRPVMDAISRSIPIATPSVRRVRNGLNLPEQSYSSELDVDLADFIYVSVGALSQFVLRLHRAICLQDPSEFPYTYDLEKDDVQTARF